MRIQGKWIYFDLLEPLRKGQKTQIWQVMSQQGGFLGDIKWYSPWRTYSFFPDSDTLYEDDCLKEIANFIGRLMNERKLRKL